jgi:hypothetical protein
MAMQYLTFLGVRSEPLGEEKRSGIGVGFLWCRSTDA